MAVPRFNIKAFLNMTPKGSHVLICILAVAFVGCLATEFLFYWIKSVHYWPAIIWGILLLGAVVFLWLLSHKDVDSGAPLPTTITRRKGSSVITVETDPTYVPFIQGMEALELLISMAHRRNPLPDPDGLIDDKGQMVPQSQQKALERIESINEQAKQAADLFDHLLSTVRKLENEQILAKHKSINLPQSQEHDKNDGPM